MQTHYDVLKVAPDAPGEVIKAAYRALAPRYHPDRNPGDAGASRAMQTLNRAYAVLSDPVRRRQYDDAIARGRPVTSRPAARRQDAPVATAVGRPHALKEYARHTPPASSAPAPVGRKRWKVVLLVLLPPAIGLGAGLWASSNRGTPSEAMQAQPPPESGSESESEWSMRSLDSSGARPARAKAPVEAAVPAEPPPAAAEPSSAPSVAPASRAPSVAWVPASPSGVRLPIVADPNGRAWPLASGYVSGLRQDFTDGLATVTIDNRGNPAPVFLKLVSLDHDPAQAIRHVHISAMDAFRIASIRPGRYELRFQNLVTGELSRSEPFELRQYEGRYSTRFSEVEITLSRFPGATLGAYPLAPEQF